MALDTGVTTWLMVSALLVMLMTPGVGFFYGGLVRKKNFISMIALSFLVLALTSIQWIVVGYRLHSALMWAGLSAICSTWA